MHSFSYSEARQNLKNLLDNVTHNHEPICIERRNGESVVVMSEQDYSSLMETAYLMRSPKNIQRLLEALQESYAGQGVIIDPKDYIDE